MQNHQLYLPKLTLKKTKTKNPISLGNMLPGITVMK